MLIIVDLSDDYCFPHHNIASTDLQPDIVCWDEAQKTVWFIELTICYETIFQAAAERKEEKYLDLATSTRSAGYSTNVITIEIGSRGLAPSRYWFNKLLIALNTPTRDLEKLQVKLPSYAPTGSDAARQKKFIDLLFFVFMLFVHLSA